MRRSRLPSDSPSMVTRPGVNRISIALWVTSIQDGCASGRQFEKMRRGRPAFSSANMASIFLAATSFQGGGLVLTCASWSVIFGFQTPLQSGSLARSVQSCAVGGGLIADGVFFGACADVCDATDAVKTKTKRDLRMVGEQIFMGYSPARIRTRRRAKVTPIQCIVKPIPRPNATTAIHMSNDIAATALADHGVCRVTPHRAILPTPTR